MKQLFLFLFVCCVAAGSNSPEINHVPFEPPSSAFFRPDDKFARPPESATPRFLFPFEFRRGGGAVTPAEVIILVQLDGHGSAKKLKVLASRHEHFTRSALEALKSAKWDSTAEVWFYYRHVYTLNK